MSKRHKNRVFLFTPDNVREFICQDVTPFLKYKDVVINPDLTAVNEVPREYWKLDKGEIRKMTPTEYKIRKVWLRVNGTRFNKDVLESLPTVKTNKDFMRKRYLLYLITFISLILLGVVVGKL